jgi:hypothetical protein
MKITTATLTETREVLVSIPDDVQWTVENGQLWIVEPGTSGVLLSTTAALKRGLLTRVPTFESPRGICGFCHEPLDGGSRCTHCGAL